MPKEKPILFSGPMVRAILSGQKTVTRRPVKQMGLQWLQDGFEPSFVADPDNAMCPYGRPGERLWVRESFAECYDYCEHPEMPGAPTEHFHLGWHYRADGEPDRKELDGFLSHWKPSIHMPRWASRILLEITAVRVERLQEISDDQARAEGVAEWAKSALSAEEQLNVSRQDGFRMLWESTGGDWDANPWVWVVEFKRVMP